MKKCLSFLVALIIFTSASSFVSCKKEKIEEIIDVSIFALIANPSEYHGKKIRTFGVIRWEFEAYELFASKEYYDNRISQNALNISLDENYLIDADIEKLDNEYVLIEGFFEKMKSGYSVYFGSSSGSINNIYRCEKW